MTDQLNAPRVAARALREARRFERSRVSLRAGVVAAIPVAGMLALGTLIGRPVIAVTMGAGAMLGGVAWRAAGPDDPPVGTMAGAAISLGVATFAGSVSGSDHWLHLILLILLAGFAGLLVSLGRRGSVPGTQAIIAYVVFGRFPQPLHSALGLAGLVVAGAGAQALFALLVALPPAWRLQREALAKGYRALAALAADPHGTSVPAAAALDDAETRLIAPTLFGDPALLRLSSLVTEGRRIRLELIVLGIQIAAGDPAGVQAQRATQLSVPVLDALAVAIADPRGGGQDTVAAALDTLEDEWGEPESGENRHAAALAGQLHAVARLVALSLTQHPWASARPSRGGGGVAERARGDLAQLRANLSLHTAAGRHALRLAAVVAVAELLAQHTALPRAYWAVVAAATVLRPEFGATFTRGAERMVGTVVGVVIATFIAVGLDPGGWGIVAVVGLLAFATYALFPANFAAGTALLTGVIVFLLHAVAPDSSTIALDRGLDTIIGGALGLAAYALWPTWSGVSTGRVMGDLVDAQRAYVVAVLDCVVAGERPDHSRLRPLAQQARLAWSNADALITLARREPADHLGDPGLRAIATLGGLRRFVYAGHVLRAEASTTETQAAQPAWRPFRDALEGTLGAISSRLRTTGVAPVAPLPDLRALYLNACRAGPVDDALLVAVDELVDATDTVASTLELPQAD